MTVYVGIVTLASDQNFQIENPAHSYVSKNLGNQVSD